MRQPGFHPAFLGAIALLLSARHSASQEPAEARQMLAAHNAVRARAGVPPLAWSTRLARVAQAWADTLVQRRRFAHQRKSPYGENLWEILGGAGDAQRVVADWAAESRNYNYSRNHCHGVCGHYTQIVWRDTSQVGCAVARGNGREIWVCEYDPPGNWAGRRPY